MEKGFKIVDRENSEFDASYCANKSSEERINALEQLREQQLTINGTRQRLQRVCAIIKRS